MFKTSQGIAAGLARSEGGVSRLGSCRLLQGAKAWLSLLIGLAVTLPGAVSASTEYDVKAVLLFNLARFVDFPKAALDSPEAPVVIGVLGYDPFGPALDEAVRGEKINGHPVRVQRYQNVKSALNSHVLFISASEQGRLWHDLNTIDNRPILTVGEQRNFLNAGGIVRFYLNAEHKVRVQIDPEAAKARGLVISSKLLRVAEIAKGR